MAVGEVCRAFRRDRKTITNWANAGKLACIRTPGGHRRYVRLQVDALLRGEELGPVRLRAELDRLTGRGG